jgi:two-component sensor histidine kinase
MADSLEPNWGRGVVAPPQGACRKSCYKGRAGQLPSRPMTRHLPIRVHLLLLSLAVLVPVLAVAGLISFRYAQDALRAIEATALDNAYDFQRELDRRVDTSLAVVESLAASSAIHRGDLEAFRAEAGIVAAARQGTVTLRDADGSPLVEASSVPGASLPVDAEDAAMERAREVARLRRTHVSGLVAGLGRAGLIEISAPVTADGRVTHVVTLAFDPSLLLTAMPRLSPSWLLAATDQDYRIIVRSRDNERFQGEKASPTFSTRLTGSSGTLESRTLDGEDVFTAYQRSPVSGWLAVASIPRTALSEPVRALWWTIAGLALIGLAASAVAALVYARYLGRELKALSGDAAAVAGEVEILHGTSGVREVAEVHKAIAEAAERLALGRRQHDVLLAELNHRVKNTLAIIQTLVGRTIATEPAPERARTALQGRVAALAAAHDALSDANWNDPLLGDLLRRLTAGRERQVALDGPAVILRPRTVVAVAQAVHELLAASLARGALKRGEPVSLAWTATPDLLQLRWREPPGGTEPLVAPADFAATIIHLCIERQLGGRTSALQGEEGVEFRWEIPARTELGPNLRIPA